MCFQKFSLACVREIKTASDMLCISELKRMAVQFKIFDPVAAWGVADPEIGRLGLVFCEKAIHVFIDSVGSCKTCF